MSKLINRADLGRVFLAGLVFVLVLKFSALTAFAHAKLLRSDPQANAKLKQAPKSVQLWFSEELEAQFSTIRVTDQNAKHVDKNNVSVSEGGKKLQIDLDDLAPGTYTVEWKALSTDQHTMKGSFTFIVVPTEATGAAQTQQPSPGASPTQRGTQSPAQVLESTQESGSGWSLSMVRWFEYLAMMMLFGGLAFQVFVFGPAVQRSRGMNEMAKAIIRNASARRIVLLSWLSLAALIITALAALMLQTSTVFDKNIVESLQPSLMSQVIMRTGFGGSWLMELTAIAALLIIVFLLSLRIKHKPSGHHLVLWWAGLAAAAILLLSPAWTGHAAAVAKEYRLAVPIDWLHMVAGAFWIGGLFHLALTMPTSLSQLDKRQRLHVLHAVIPVFTRLAIVSTVLIVLTGVYNSWIHVDSFQALWSTAYGKTLSLKVLLVLPMLVLGGINTFVIHPRTSRVIQKDEGADASDPSALDKSFYRSVGIEAAFGCLVLLVASVLVFLTPARTHPSMSENKAAESIVNETRK
jgi:copper transport protein